MDIIQRNFFRLLRAGSFGNDDPIEPMSAFKWRRLFQMVEAQHVADIFLKGVERHRGEPGMNAPDNIIAAAQKKADSLPGIAETIRQPIGMSAGILDKRFQKVLNDERHSIDTSVEAMDLLRLIVINEQNFLNQGIMMKGIVQMGQFLREKGNRVDFVKLENWLQQLQLQNIAQLQGSILIDVFDFEQSELPFVHRHVVQARKLAIASVSDLAKDAALEWHFRQTQTGFVSNNSAIMRRNLRRSIRYVPYAPVETVCNFFCNLAKSLSEIEE